MTYYVLSVCDRLTLLGYSNVDFASIKFRPEVLKSIPLTDGGEESQPALLRQFTYRNGADWPDIKVSLIRHIEEVRDTSLWHAKQERNAERRNIVDGIYSAFKDRRSPFECRLLPHIFDLCSVPELKDRIEAGTDIEATPEAFSDIVDRLPTLILSYERIVMREASATLSRNIAPDYSTEAVNLNLAASVLCCSLCRALIFGWGDLLEHHCLPSRFGLTAGLRQVTAAENRKYYRPTESITLQVIRLAGLDPATATIADMDTVDLPYFCSFCLFHLYVPNDLQQYYSWRSIVSLVFPFSDYTLITFNALQIYHHGSNFQPSTVHCTLERATDEVVEEYRTLRSISSSHRDELCIWHCNRCARDFPEMVRRDCVHHLEAE